jgi:pyridinium-3,5-bisthiocarboxylic acid mononucleotide nickel chelatase
VSAVKKKLAARSRPKAKAKRPRAHDHAHDGHAHAHAHDGHGHTHAPLAKSARTPLAKGAGKGKILFFDAPSGLAGDMIIAALVDLGVPERVITEAVAALPLRGFHLHFGARERSGIVATSFDVHVDRKQPERTYGAIRQMLERAPLASAVRARAQATFRKLAESEAQVHRMPIEDVHFHEVGAVDAIVDVVGSSAALAYLGARVLVSPLPMGHGFVKARHGVLPLPAPAVVGCLKGLATYDGGIAFELVTPTGAAIVGAHAEGSVRWPAMAPERAGWGAGTASLADRPNLLRAVLGDPASEGAGGAATHAVLEANVDDATGEILGSCIEALLQAGALDAWAVPNTTKKGRPAFVLGAITTVSRADEIVRVMMTESPTIGVRRHDVTRVERPRTIANVTTRFGELPVKVSTGPYGPPQRKPEFDACAEAARAHGVPVREVLEAVLAAAVSDG